MRAQTIIALSMLLGGTAWGVSQMTHGNMDHSSHEPGMPHGTGTVPTPSGGAMLTEPGQGAFAALSEVVRVLEADPATDWSKVDLSGLRDHLRDMDRLVSDAVVEARELPNGLSVTVSGDADTVDTVRRMVPAHAKELAKDERWSVVANATDRGAELTVTSDDPAVVARIKGLGFFGLMASQDHHREHHMMMARGEGAHGH